MLSPTLKVLAITGLTLSCSQGSINPSDTRPKIPERSTLDASRDAEGTASEPVPVGGAYLICAYTAADQSAAACRMEDKAKKKFAFNGAKPSDLAPLDASGKKLAVSFALAPSFSFWHWVTVGPIQTFPISTIKLDARYKADKESDKSSVLWPNHPQVINPVTSDPSGNASVVLIPLPVQADLDRVPVNSQGGIEVAAPETSAQIPARFWWFLADQGASCEQFCAPRGGFVESVTAEWSRNPAFCQEMLFKLYPEREGKVSIVKVPDARGLGCFTEGSDTQIALYVDSSTFSKSASSPTSRRFCACELGAPPL